VADLFHLSQLGFSLYPTNGYVKVRFPSIPFISPSLPFLSTLTDISFTHSTSGVTEPGALPNGVRFLRASSSFPSC
jgi:hypothetical protein